MKIRVIIADAAGESPRLFSSRVAVGLDHAHPLGALRRPAEHRHLALYPW